MYFPPPHRSNLQCKPVYTGIKSWRVAKIIHKNPVHVDRDHPCQRTSRTSHTNWAARSRSSYDAARTEWLPFASGRTISKGYVHRGAGRPVCRRFLYSVPISFDLRPIWGIGRRDSVFENKRSNLGLCNQFKSLGKCPMQRDYHTILLRIGIPFNVRPFGAPPLIWSLGFGPLTSALCRMDWYASFSSCLMGQDPCPFMITT